MEGEDHGAVLVDIVPGSRGWDSEVHDEVIVTFDVAVDDGDRQGLGLGGAAGVDLDFAAGECCDSERAPHARRPPTALGAGDPVQGRGDGEGMDNPRFADVRMEDDSVDGSEIVEAGFYLGLS